MENMANPLRDNKEGKKYLNHPKRKVLSSTKGVNQMLSLEVKVCISTHETNVVCCLEIKAVTKIIIL